MEDCALLKFVLRNQAGPQNELVERVKPTCRAHMEISKDHTMANL